MTWEEWIERSRYLAALGGAAGGWRGGKWAYRMPLEGNDPGEITLGGPDVDPANNQVGYEAPPTIGLLSMAWAEGDRPDDLVTVDIDQAATSGIVFDEVDLPIYGVPVVCPVRLTVRPSVPLTRIHQLYCSVVPGSSLVGAGLHRTRTLPQNQDEIAIPQWARSIAGPFVAGADLQLSAALPFVASAVIPNTAGFPAILPTWARYVRLSAGVANAWAIFLGTRS